MLERGAENKREREMGSKARQEKEAKDAEAKGGTGAGGER